MNVFRRVTALLLLPALALALCACGAQTEPARPLVVWYALEGEPLASALEALAADYNGTREKGAAAVTPHAFDDEAALLRALESGAVPDLLLCPHALAFTLSERGLLKAPSVPSPPYPDWLRQRADCVGRGFYPIGFDLLVLRSASPGSSDLSALLREAAAFGAERGQACLRIDAFAPLFYQVLLTQGIEFTADFEKCGLIEDYVNLYNQIADAAFSHGLVPDALSPVPRRLAFGSLLHAEAAEAAAFSLLPAGPRLAEGHGLAVLSREPRMRGDLGRFLRWLLTPERLSAAALEAGLVPALTAPLSPAGPLEALLLEQTGQEFHLPEARSQYYVNHPAFETSFREALRLLH